MRIETITISGLGGDCCIRPEGRMRIETLLDKLQGQGLQLHPARRPDED